MTGRDESVGPCVVSLLSYIVSPPHPKHNTLAHWIPHLLPTALLRLQNMQA